MTDPVTPEQQETVFREFLRLWRTEPEFRVIARMGLEVFAIGVATGVLIGGVLWA